MLKKNQFQPTIKNILQISGYQAPKSRSVSVYGLTINIFDCEANEDIRKISDATIDGK